MSHPLLDPTLDITFKLLLLRHQELLRDMIEAVLGLREPLQELVVLNISILWFKEPILESPRFHSKFRLAEDDSREVFSPEIEIHVLELTKLRLASADRQAKLERWARFLRARTVEALEELAREDDIMIVAKNALEELSADSDAQRLARERETSVLVHRHLLASSRIEGRLEGEAVIIERLLTKKFGAVPDWVQDRLRNAKASELEEWADRLLVADSVEAVFEVQR